jgi:hypothetical protein
MCEKSPAYLCNLLFTSSDLYAPPQHVDPFHAAGVTSEGVLAPLGGRTMPDPANQLRRILLLGNMVNKPQTKANSLGIHRQLLNWQRT